MGYKFREYKKGMWNQQEIDNGYKKILGKVQQNYEFSAFFSICSFKFYFWSNDTQF